MKILGWCLLLVALFSGGLRAGTLMEPISGKPAAEEFRLDAVNGGSVSLYDFRGKFVLLNFWATWCAPCRSEMPALNSLHKEMSSDGLVVVGVHVGPSLNGVNQFLDQVPVEFTILIDQDMGLTNWGVLGLPTTFLVNPEGRLVYKAVGERKWNSKAMKRFLARVVSDHSHMVKEKSPAPAESFFEKLINPINWL